MQRTLFEATGTESATRAKRVRSASPRIAPEKVGAYSLDSIHYMDCIEGMKGLPDCSVDVAIVDPPYNASKGSVWKWDNCVRLPGFGGNWSKVMVDWDDMPLAEYFRFTMAWLAELKRVVRPSGSLWIHGTYHNIGLINFALQLLEVEIINEVVWFKRNSFPNLSGRRLTASHETILWAHTGKGKREYLFNYDAAKEMACPEDPIKERGKQMRTVWDIPNNKDRKELRFGKHPTQKPLRLLKRMLALSAKEGQVLLVPFVGAGSDCVAAAEMGIHFLGFETDREYLGIATKRLAEVTPQSAVIASGNEPQQQDEFGSDRAVWWTPRNVKLIPSLVKWTGSKRSQAASIAREMPQYRRYFEPFLGGGAVLYLAARPGSVASDVYAPLIDLWRMVQAEPQRVVADYERQWKALQDDLPGYYYATREATNVSFRGGKEWRCTTMKATLTIDETLLRHAAKLTGVKEKASLVRLGLEALIARESARRLAQLGGTEKGVRTPRRRRVGRAA